MELKRMSEKWYVDGKGNYHLDLGYGTFAFYGKPVKESEVVKKILDGKLAFSGTGISIVDGKKIYHVCNPNTTPIPHFSILVE